MQPLVNIIGAGNLGKTIGHLLFKNNSVKIGGVLNTTYANSNNSIEFIGDGSPYINVHELPSSDITLITVPDDFIIEVCNELSKSDSLKKNSIVLHCSGSLNSESLASVKEKGCLVASAHPMTSFASPDISIKQYGGTYCAIEGDQEALPTVHFLFESIGSITYEINKNKKSLYHAAGVFASNYLVTLAEKSLACMKEVGVDPEIAMRIITNIMKSTVFNLEKTLSPQQALTGPIKRGDASTILSHMQSLEQEKALYSILGNETLSLTDHSDEKIRELKSILRCN